MKEIVLLFVCVIACVATASDSVVIPSTLEESHAALERILSVEELKRIDGMKSEEEMIVYHHGLGTGLRNDWGLWKGGKLRTFMNELGFTHPDDMSAVLLETFWCRRHGKEFRLKERAEEYAIYWKQTKEAANREKARVAGVKAELEGRMMGLTLDQKGMRTVRMPDRAHNSIRVRFLAPFRRGVFLAARYSIDWRKDIYGMEGYFFDPDDQEIHKVVVKEIDEMHSAVVAGDKAWFAGVGKGGSKLVGVKGDERIVVDLPEDGHPPQLGLDGDFLLAVYSHKIYRLKDAEWEALYAGEVQLPFSGPPPTRHGDKIFFRDEGSGENNKRLWWLTLGAVPKLISLEDDLGIIGPEGPRWENCFSYAVTTTGDLWVTAGEGYTRQSVLRRASDGQYSVAIMNNGLGFTTDLFGSDDTDQGLSIFGLAALENNGLLLVGDRGLFRLSGEELVQVLSFENTHQEIPVEGGKNVYGWSWDPSSVLVLADGSYFIGSTFGGTYLLKKKSKDEWDFSSLDEKLGRPVQW